MIKNINVSITIFLCVGYAFCSGCFFAENLQNEDKTCQFLMGGERETLWFVGADSLFKATGTSNSVDLICCKSAVRFYIQSIGKSNRYKALVFVGLAADGTDYVRVLASFLLNEGASVRFVDQGMSLNGQSLDAANARLVESVLKIFTQPEILLIEHIKNNANQCMIRLVNNKQSISYSFISIDSN